MKKILGCFLVLLTVIAASAQSPYNDVPLAEKKDYKAAEPSILKAVDYLFTSKYDKDDLDRLYAIEFIMKWMGGTPDFSFELNEKFSKPFSVEDDLLGMYMAAMAKLALENNNQTSNQIGINAAKLIINYSNKPSNNLKQTGELKRMAAAMKKGELEKYFGI